MLFRAWDEDILADLPHGWFLWHPRGPVPAEDDPARYQRWATPLAVYGAEHYYLECPCGERALLPVEVLSTVLHTLRGEAVSSIGLDALAGRVLHQ